jgi:thiamine-monophosphate kinase
MPTELNELGEFELIKELTKDVEIYNSSTIKGVGDDAAVISAANEAILVTNDLLVEGIHFDLMYTPLKHLGYKSVVVNLSDIYAMNGIPQQVTVGIALSSKFSLEAVNQLYEGIKLACKTYGVDLVGGDTTSSLTGLMISITAIGRAPFDKVTYRNGAKENNLICVSGDLGGAYLGVQILEREKRIFKENPTAQPKLEDYKYVVGRQLKPEARKDVVEKLKELDIQPTAMIDISDGLSSEIMHICTQSGVGCRIYEDKIPVNKESEKVASELGIHPLTAALNGGEDYELLFTVNMNDYEKIKDIDGITVIGHITNQAEGYNLINNQGMPIKLKAMGWKNFEK